MVSKETVTDRKSFKVVGGKIFIYGDLHLSSTFEGQHINYLEECLYTLDTIKNEVLRERPSAVFFLGDIIGVRERNIKDRRFLRECIRFFMLLNEVTNGNVYAVKGNHDFGDYSDFDLLVGLDLLKHPQYVDYYGKNKLEIRFHFVDYGDEKKRIFVPTGEECSNVVLCHCDVQIPGVTTWYTTRDGVVLSSLNNWSGVDLVIAGHIHNPSTEIAYTTLNDASVGLFYPGSPARVAERYDNCWYMVFEYNTEAEETDYSAKLFGLRKVYEVFYPKEAFLDYEEELVDEKGRTQSLTNIVKEIMSERMLTGDLFAQIDVLPSASPEVKLIAKKYLQRAIDEVKSKR